VTGENAKTLTGFFGALCFEEWVVGSEWWKRALGMVKEAEPKISFMFSFLRPKGYSFIKSFCGKISFVVWLCRMAKRDL